MGNGLFVMQLSQSFGIEGFCEQGIFFKLESFSLICILAGVVIFCMTLYLNQRSKGQEVNITKSSNKKAVSERKIKQDRNVKANVSQASKNHSKAKCVPIKGLSQMTIGIALTLTFLMSAGCWMAEDLFTYFICFQLLLLVSYVLLVQKQTKEAIRAGNGYLTYGLLTGMVMLMGMFLLSHEADTTNFETLRDYVGLTANKNIVYLSGILFLIGFSMNAGIFPLHTWMDKAYKEISLAMGGFFASIGNKAGLIGIWMMTDYIFSGDATWGKIVMTLGFLTALVGCIRSFLSRNSKEALCFANMASMGLLVIGIGSGANILYPMLAQMIGSFLIFAVVGYLEEMGMEIDLQVISCSKVNPIGAGQPILMLGFVIGTVLLSGLAFWMSRSVTEMAIFLMLFGLLVLMDLVKLFMIFFTGADVRKQSLCKMTLPAWLSLEKYVYEPLVMHLIPFICAVLLRACDKLVDGTVAGLRKTVFRDKKQRVWDKVGTPFTYVCGTILDEFILFLNKTCFKKNPIRICFVNELAYLKSGLSLTSKIVVRSVSFGLLMFCIGLCLTLGYLLIL